MTDVTDFIGERATVEPGSAAARRDAFMKVTRKVWRGHTLKVALALACSFAACAAPREPTRAHDATLRSDSDSASRTATNAETSSRYGEPEVLARLEDRSIDESSGLVVSRNNPGIFWTHNDSGDAPLIFAFDRAGRHRGIWRVKGAEARDWEDVARGPGPSASRSYLYVGDIGDNGANRNELRVYRFPEPDVSNADIESSRRSPRATEPAEVLRFRYPEGFHNAETLLVHPTTGDLYILTKTPGGSSIIFKAAAPLRADALTTLKRVGEFMPPTLIGGMLTGGDISPDGRRVVLCDYSNGYEFLLDDTTSAFDDIWRRQAKTFSLGERKQGEAVAYGPDGTEVFATSEGARTPLIRVSIKTEGGQ